MARVPGPPYPAPVQTALYLARPEAFLRECHEKYGDVFTIQTVVFGPEVCVVRPDAIKTIFTGDADKLRAGEANIALEPVVGTRSVLLLDGAEHLRQRRLMMPPFHGERMLAYARTMRDVTGRIVDDWAVGEKITLHAHMQRLTLEIILRTIFGADEGAELTHLRDAIAGFLDHMASAVTMIGTLPPLRRDAWGMSPWAAFKRVRAKVDAEIFEVIARRRAERAAGAPARDDVLSMLLDARDEDGAKMTDEELRDELMTLLSAGHETTATELCWAFDKILRAPDVLRRIEEEIAAATNGSDAPSFDALPYLDATIKEVLRLAPVVPAVGRRVKEATRIDGFDVPAGVMLVPAIWLTHRLPDLYPEPLAFRPQRFLGKKPDPYEWLPFGGGLRRCLGMAFALYEMKVVLATVLARVRLRPVESTPPKVALRGFTHAPRGGVPVVVEARRRARADAPERAHASAP